MFSRKLALGCLTLVLTAPLGSVARQADTGTFAGAIIGGLLGNHVGGGKGKVVATVVGAIAGGILGHELGEVLDEEARESRDHAVEHCLRQEASSDEGWGRDDGRYHGRVVVAPAVYQYQEYQVCRTYYNEVVYNGGYVYSQGIACQTQGNWHMVRESQLSRQRPDYLRGEYRYDSRYEGGRR